MKRIGNITLLGVVPLSLMASSAQAAINPALFYTPSGILDVAILLGALICLIWSAKVMSLLKGGMMSKSWQMFSLGFGFLLIARILSLGETTNLMALPGYVLAALYFLMIATWLLGLYQTKRVLG